MKASMLDITREVRDYRADHVPKGRTEFPGGVRVYDTPDATDTGFVDHVREALGREEKGAETKGGIILSTGRTFESVYEKMAATRDVFQRFLRGRALMNQDELWTGGKEVANPEWLYRNYIHVRVMEALGLNGGVDWIIPQCDNPSLDAATRDFRSRICSVPKISLAMLGIGPDAKDGMNGSSHIGFIAPHTSRDVVADAVRLDTITRTVNGDGDPSYPEFAITNGPAHIARAREIDLIAKGSSKPQNVARTLLGPYDPEVPSSHLAYMRNVYFFLDRQAAEETMRRLGMAA